jgi:hypothetical protein
MKSDITGIVFAIFVIGFILALVVRAILEAAGVSGGKLLTFLQKITIRPTQLTALAPYQVAIVSLWYFACLGVAVYLSYALIASPDLPFLDPESSQKLVEHVNRSETARFLTQCFACGVVGATLYGILWISRIQESTTEWYFRRYLLLPVLGGFLGASSYLFVKAGLITVQQTSSAESAGGAAGVSAFAVWGIAFLSGFASRELTAKLIQIAEAVFAKAPETSPVTPSRSQSESTQGQMDEEKQTSDKQTVDESVKATARNEANDRDATRSVSELDSGSTPA